jgi:hypothetical protein
LRATNVKSRDVNLPSPFEDHTFRQNSPAQTRQPSSAAPAKVAASWRAKRGGRGARDYSWSDIFGTLGVRRLTREKPAAPAVSLT